MSKIVQIENRKICVFIYCQSSELLRGAEPSILKSLELAPEIFLDRNRDSVDSEMIVDLDFNSLAITSMLSNMCFVPTKQSAKCVF
jgi:hypothetical protein